MKQYVIYQKSDFKIVFNFKALNDSKAIKQGLSYMLGLGLNVHQVKKNFKIVEITKDLK